MLPHPKFPGHSSEKPCSAAFRQQGGDPQAVTGPIFIGGMHRSGTGMLRAVLGSNSQLAMPPHEFRFFAGVGNRAVDSPETAIAVLSEILSFGVAARWGLQTGDAGTLLAGTDYSRKAMYSMPLQAYAAQIGKPRFGEKTPCLEQHFETLLEWFGPSMRFIQMIRNPVSTYLSREYHGGVRNFFNPVDIARLWLASARKGVYCATRYPKIFMLVEYEKFLADPEGVLKQICDFCSLPPEIERMLAMKDFARKYNSSFGQSMASAKAGHEIRTPDRDNSALSGIATWLIKRELGPPDEYLSRLRDKAADISPDVPMATSLPDRAARFAGAALAWGARKRNRVGRIFLPPSSGDGFERERDRQSDTSESKSSPGG